MMSLRSLILFGSHARGDHELSSDLDIIAVVDEKRIAPYENGALSVNFYSEPFLLKICEIGNLFALHVVSEGKKIYDPSNVLGQMSLAFRKKRSYAKEISDASMLGYFLLRHFERVRDWRLFNKRVAWCVRTILIATAYENGHAIFSARDLSNFFQSKDAFSLIESKSTDLFVEGAQFKLARFLRDHGSGDPKVYDVDNIIGHIEYIFRSDNVVGKNTIASLFGAAHQEYLLERSAWAS